MLSRTSHATFRTSHSFKRYRAVHADAGRSVYYGGAVHRHLVSGFVPSALGNIAQAQDRTIWLPTTIPEFVETKIPGMTSRVPADIDITGQPAQRPVSELGGANPFPISTVTNDPVTKLAASHSNAAAHQAGVGSRSRVRGYTSGE